MKKIFNWKDSKIWIIITTYTLIFIQISKINLSWSSFNLFTHIRCMRILKMPIFISCFNMKKLIIIRILNLLLWSLWVVQLLTLIIILYVWKNHLLVNKYLLKIHHFELSSIYHFRPLHGLKIHRCLAKM